MSGFRSPLFLIGLSTTEAGLVLTSFYKVAVIHGKERRALIPEKKRGRTIHGKERRGVIRWP